MGTGYALGSLLIACVIYAPFAVMAGRGLDRAGLEAVLLWLHLAVPPLIIVELLVFGWRLLRPRLTL
ncbi:MAG: hypothetical protein ACFB6S_12595 [Geminicoccaceae bacterium]